MTLVDSNVLLDVIQDDARWGSWSGAQLAAAFDRGPVVINPIVFAEVSTGFNRREDATEALDALDFEYADLPWDAAFIAGKAFARYRRDGGIRRSPLPDFYIGAHALVSGMTLLTRDGTRYRSYFPKLKIVSP